MKIPNFVKNIANKSISITNGVDKQAVISAVRDEAHQFAFGFVLKQIILFSSVFFVVGFIFGAVITYFAK